MEVQNRKTSGSQSRTRGEIVGYSRKHHNSAGCATVWVSSWDKIKTKQKPSATRDSCPIGTTPGGRTRGKPEWRRSCGNEEAEVNRKEMDWSGAGTGKTRNGPEIKLKYEKDVQRLRHNPGVELKTRIERGDSVHEGKHGKTLIFQMKYWTWLRQIYTKVRNCSPKCG
ncbi:hypothetical protein DFH09DRAFT_1081062 [Mycena vulgaris]|nr:hypothetical protein DFH09DRAFT_1081062 [Mycena vulgaris]